MAPIPIAGSAIKVDRLASFLVNIAKPCLVVWSMIEKAKTAEQNLPRTR